MAFEITVKEQIRLLKNPSLKCVDLVISELSKIVATLTDKVYYLFFLDILFIIHALIYAFNLS